MVIRERLTPQLISGAGPCLHRYALLLVVLFLLLLSACTFSYLYRQLDWLIPWHLSDYVSVDNTQRSELERRLIARLEWHCGTQLTAYAEWFREMRRAPHPFSRTDLEHHYRRSLEFWHVLMEKLSPDISTLLISASDAQVKELMSNLELRNQELEKRYVKAGWKKVRQRRIERMEEILRRWIGPLNEKQQQALERWSRELGKSGDDWIESRRRWQRALGDALAHRADRERFAERIRILFVEPRQLWPEAYRKEYGRLLARTLDMLAEVAAAETPEQQRHFNEKLLSWVDDFERLACRPHGNSDDDQQLKSRD